MKICLLGVSFDTNNMGVNALTVGSITAALRQFPDAEISILDYAKEPREIPFAYHGKTLSIPLVNMRFSKKFYLRNNIARLIAVVLATKLIPSRALRLKALRRNPWLRHIEGADVIACISGGDSFSDIYGLERFFYTSLPLILVLLMGKELVFLPQTIGPFQNRMVTTIARWILRRAEIVYSRDHRGTRTTEALLNLNGNSNKAKLCYDVGFVLEPQTPESVECVRLPQERDPRAHVVGLNVSGLLYAGGYSHKNMFGLMPDYRRLVLHLIDFFVSEKGAVVLLTPHVFGTCGESDSPACEELYEDLKGKYQGRLGLVRGSYNQSEIKHIIGRCDFFVGSRMHACIAAVSQNVPAVSIAYSDKFIGVMETVGIEDLVADARKLDEAAILRLVGEAYERRALIRRQLEQKIPQIKERVFGLFREIAEAANSAQAPAGALAGRS